MDSFDVSIIKYLGKVNDGIIVLISLFYNKEVSYDATFFYTDKQMILTISEEFEQIIGDIKNHPQYTDILRDILKRIVPYNEMIDRIDKLDVKPYIEAIFPDGEFE
jgi:hypothetical protein